MSIVEVIDRTIRHLETLPTAERWLTFAASAITGICIVLAFCIAVTYVVAGLRDLLRYEKRKNDELYDEPPETPIFHDEEHWR